jgi:hypothetical protein
VKREAASAPVDDLAPETEPSPTTTSPRTREGSIVSTSIEAQYGDSRRIHFEGSINGEVVIAVDGSPKLFVFAVDLLPAVTSAVSDAMAALRHDAVACACCEAKTRPHPSRDHGSTCTWCGLPAADSIHDPGVGRVLGAGIRAEGS